MGRVLLALLWSVLIAARSVGAQEARELLWGADAEGGAPFVEADPADPTRVRGFDVEIAELVAGALGRTPRFLHVAFASLDQSARRGDFLIGLGGIEDAAGRRASLAVTVPYYRFREVLTVRAVDRERFRTLADLRGSRVGTLGATLAYDLLLRAETTAGITAVSYDDDVHPYDDLLSGRLDAVLLDHVLAERAMRRRPGLHTHAEPLAHGYYVGILAPEQTALRDRVNDVLRAAMRDGRLEAIFRRWGVWNDDQPALYHAVTGGAETLLGTETSSGASAVPSPWEATRRYLPALLEAAGITLVLSCAAMALAVCLGVLIAIGRVYGPSPLSALLLAYVEVMRGTPLLLQLFVLYYGLADLVRLPPFLAAMTGLGLNYAAYESEVYRSSLEAVPRGQLEAARTLGFREWQVLRLIRGPQALRLALAPMTNDFVALLKDSSLVSVLTVVELTKQTQIFATNIGSWIVPGALCAVLYLALSLPIGHAARRLEQRWRMATP